MMAVTEEVTTITIISISDLQVIIAALSSNIIDDVKYFIF
jgi:hypothetical protein